MWAYIYEHPGADPATDRFELDKNGERSVMVPVPEPGVAPDVAKRLVEVDGVELIELCGGFTLPEAARVVEVIGGRVPVGHVTFAVDSVPAAAAYAAAFASSPPTAPGGASTSGSP